MELLNLLRHKILGLGKPRSTLLCLGLIVAGLMSIFAGYQFSSSIMVFLGSIGGVLWFVSFDALWASSAPSGLRSRLDLHARRPLFQRRITAAGIIIVWFILVVVLGRSLRDLEGSFFASASDGGALESPLLGALTVVVFLIAFRVGSSTEQEREIEETVYEEWISRQQEKRRKSKDGGRLRRRNKKRERREQEEFEDYGEDDEYEDGLPVPPPN